MKVKITKHRNLIKIEPAEKWLAFLAKELTYSRITMLYGWAKVKKKKNVEVETEQLFSFNKEENSLITMAPLLTRVYEVLESQGCTIEIQDTSPAKVYTPQLDEIVDIKLRSAQKQMLAYIASCNYGQFNGVTGMGKSVIITQACRMYPYEKYKIVVCAQQRPIVSALHASLRKFIPDVGMVGNGCNAPARVTVATAKSLKKTDPANVDLLFYDEVHTAAGKEVSRSLLDFVNARRFGFSASTGVRTDRADLLVESIFGPVRTYVDMKEGQDEGYIPPVEAYFYEVKVPDNSNYSTPTRIKREAIWANSVRNNALAEITRMWETTLEGEGKVPQILIMSDSLEHVLRIKKYLPDYDIIYASSQKQQISNFREKGLLPDNFKPMSDKERKDKIRAFETGRLRKVISTTTLGVGVDAPGLDVIIRADGGSSEVGNIQFRGRVMRGSSGIYIDIIAMGDPKQNSKSLTRLSSAKSAGWPVYIVPQLLAGWGTPKAV